MNDIDDILIEMGADPAMRGVASDALRRKAEKLLIERMRTELLTAPAEQLTGWKPWPSPSPLKADGEGRVTIPLPDDFLRLMSLRLSAWERPVTEILQPTHWLYKLQSQRWEGLRGTPRRPLAFAVADKAGRRCLELYSATPGSEVGIMAGWYLPEPKIDH